jgi:hypothetical protein
MSAEAAAEYGLIDKVLTSALDHRIGDHPAEKMPERTRFGISEIGQAAFGFCLLDKCTGLTYRSAQSCEHLGMQAVTNPDFAYDRVVTTVAYGRQKSSSGEKLLYCSFCGKSQHEEEADRRSVGLHLRRVHRPVQRHHPR